ncbi:MAG: DUF3800 domain-containing protein [Chloroflexi bacterium]|nr:DUF3800 domain-containing protein [Chloroflexota bacterium]
MAYLYVFIDESGNYDFSSSGTANWVLTSLITEDIRPGLIELYDLKHKLIDLGTDLEYFHAAEDRQAVRDEVFDIIYGLSNIRADSVVVEKRKTGPSIRSIEKFYPMMLEKLLNYPFDPRGIDVTKYDRIFIFCDRASGTKRQQQALIAGIKSYLSRNLKGIPYQVCMHSSASHHYLQIVDYISWAIYVYWERGENRPLDRVRHLVKSQFQIFQSGSTIWY